jgi:PIN domain nuclease of toxin-antitoxin system
MSIAGSDGSPRILLDTHTLLWMIENRKHLGAAAWQAVNLAVAEARILISAITPWEIALLVSKKRIELSKDVMEWVEDALTMPGVTLVGLEPEIAVASTRLPFEMHPDPADRILVATARRLSATLVTADGALLQLARKRYFHALNAEK